MTQKVNNEDVKKRVLKEMDELHDKIEALTAFLDTPQFELLPRTQQGLLLAQQPCMTAYFGILNMRMADMEGTLE